ncbi:MAG: FG-GAP-like repeat-containing protein [Bacteroidota bacterium]
MKSIYSNKTITTFIALLSLPFLFFAQSFREISQQIGINNYCLDENIIGGGVAFFDYNQDLYPDIFIIGGERSNSLYRNNWDGTFTNVSQQAGIELKDKNTVGIAVGDIDNDGDSDLFITTASDQANVLLENQGNGTFVDISKQAGIVERAWSTSATFGDFNRDGILDIYVNNYADFENYPFAENIDRCLPNFLYQNLGGNQFVEVAEDLKVADVGCGLAVTFTDYDADSDPDLYVANDFGLTFEANALYLNDFSKMTFEQAPFYMGMSFRINSMGIAIGDYDEDGDLDYYTTNIADNLLLSNEKEIYYFREVAFRTNANNPDGTSWGTAFWDYNNDSYLDLVVANGQVIDAQHQNNENRLFQGNAQHLFEDVSQVANLADTTRCRGLAIADYDLDGDLDLLLGVVAAEEQSEVKSLFYQNRLEDTQNWLRLHLQGTASNQDGYGSRVRIIVGDRSLIREVDGGSSYLSHSDPAIHFGLGEQSIIDSLIIDWTSGQQDLYTNIASNQNLLVLENSKYLPYLHQEISIFEGDSIFLANAFQTEAGVYHHITANQQGQETLFITRLTLEPAPVITYDAVTFKASPNPFSSSTQLEYTLLNASPINIQIFDSMGRNLDLIFEGTQDAGKHFLSEEVLFSSLPNGIYTFQMTVAGEIYNLRLVKAE